MTQSSYSAFRGESLVVSDHLRRIAKVVRELSETGGSERILIFDDLEGRQVDIDLHGSAEEVARRRGGAPDDAFETRNAPNASRGRGRPKLGAIGREVTLLPRHWLWLESQRDGPSATLRRLVDQARAASAPQDRLHEAQDAIHRFITAIAGDPARLRRGESSPLPRRKRTIRRRDLALASRCASLRRTLEGARLW